MAFDAKTELDKLTTELTAATKKIATLESEAKARERTPAGRVNKGFGAPGVVTNYNTNSRGFSLCRAVWAQRTGDVSKAKEEQEACHRFRKSLAAAGHAPAASDPNSFLVPMGHELLPADVTDQEDYKVFKSMWDAGVEGVDPDEMAWLHQRVRKTPMSYLFDNIGGTLVAPPVQGDLIELVRPRECLMAAGATTVPLPPNGRIVYPRQTSPTSMYWIGENTSITESNPQTGQLVMQAKKGAVFTTVPNELLLYASVAADALIRNDMSKTIALGIDYAGLYGTGGAAQPKGLILYNGSNEVIDYAGVTPAPKGVATNGNTLRPEDGYRMTGLLEDRNFEMKGWIFRPTMANNIMGYRADAVTPADAAGAFVQSMMRAVSDKLPGTNWVGYPVTKSAVVRNNVTKGSSGATLTEVFGGQWEHFLIGMYGAVELASSNLAGNTFQQDQTAIRALCHVDTALRYGSSFVWYKELINAMN